MNGQIKLNARLAMLQPGIYIIRFQEGYALPEGLVVGVHPSPLGKAEVEFLSSHSLKTGALTKVGDTVVVKVANDTAAILIAEYGQLGLTANAPVEIAIDTIGGVAKKQQVVLSTADQTTPENKGTDNASDGLAPIALKAFTVNGTAIVSPNGQIGDLHAPNKDQGISAFVCSANGLPAGVMLNYGCKNVGGAQEYVATAGNMVGLPKVKLPICAVRFGLTGENAGYYELAGSVAFAGQPPSQIVSSKELTGPTGREVLCALSVSIMKRADKPGFTPSKSVWEHPSVISNGSKRPKSSRKE